MNLPIEKISCLSKKKLLIITFSVVLVILSTNFTLYFFFSKNSVNIGYAIVKEKWELIKNTSKPVSWLVIGDSAGNQGVQTSKFNDEFGGHAYNLCTTASYLSLDDAWMLDYYLKNNTKPDNILIIHVYDVWDRDFPKSLLSQIPIEIIFDKSIEPEINLNLLDKASILFYKYFPLYSRNLSLQELIKNPKKTLKNNISFSESGFMPYNSIITKKVKIDAKKHLKYVKNKSFNINTDNVNSLNHIAKLAEKNNINVYFANSPIYDSLYYNPIFNSYYKKIQNYISEFCINNNWIYINNPPITFSESEMQNSDHLLLNSSIIYTNKLINDIKSHNNKKN